MLVSEKSATKRRGAEAMDKKQLLAELKDLVNKANYYVRSSFTMIAGDFEDLEMNEIVKECYNIPDTLERLENLLKKEGF